MSSSADDRATMLTSPRLQLLARVIFGLTIPGIAAGIWFSIIDAGKVQTDLAFLLSFCLFPIIGYILAIRRPDNAINWLMLGIGAVLGLNAFVASYASYAIHGGVGGYRLGAIAIAFDQPMWVPIVGLPATFLILLFPDGHLPSPRWTVVPGSWADHRRPDLEPNELRAQGHGCGSSLGVGLTRWVAQIRRSKLA